MSTHKPRDSDKASFRWTVLVFLIGLALLVCPAVQQVVEVNLEAEEYEALREMTQPAVQEEAMSESAETVLPIESLTEETPMPVAATDVPAKATDQPITTGTPMLQTPGMTPNPEVSPAATVLTKQPAANLDACKAQNADFIAWLKIPGTPVDYPVVQSDRTDYYLHHLFSGKKSKLGCLFSLSSADYKTPGANIAIYGHHLSTSNAMFSSLIDYKQKGYYEQHPIIHLDSLYHSARYDIFAVCNIKVSDWDAATAEFPNKKAFLEFTNRAREQSLYDTGIVPDEDDCILTLITCDRSYGGVSGRLIVMAVEMK